MNVFGQCFGGLDSQTVDVEIFCELAGIEEFLGLDGGTLADGDAGEADDVAAAIADRQKEVSDG